MESVKINDRLLSAVPFVREGMRLADIGTDHAYLPIHLVMSGKIESAVAVDINQGPLDKAQENILKYSFNDSISTVLCDGLSKTSLKTLDLEAFITPRIKNKPFTGMSLVVKFISFASQPKTARRFFFKMAFAIFLAILDAGIATKFNALSFVFLSPLNKSVAVVPGQTKPTYFLPFSSMASASV